MIDPLILVIIVVIVIMLAMRRPAVEHLQDLTQSIRGKGTDGKTTGFTDNGAD